MKSRLPSLLLAAGVLTAILPMALSWLHAPFSSDFLAYGAPNKIVITKSTVSVNNTSTLIANTDPGRLFLSVQNDSDTDIYCTFGGAALTHNGMRLVANGGGWMYDTSVSQQNLFCISSNASGKNVLLQIGK